PDAADIYVLPQLWFRNTWSWYKAGRKPSLERLGQNLLVHHEKLGEHVVQFDHPNEIVFCDNETNLPKLYGVQSPHGYYKDGFHDYVVKGNKAAINPMTRGTKAAAIHKHNVAPGASVTVRLRLNAGQPKGDAFTDFAEIVTRRKAEADAF